MNLKKDQAISLLDSIEQCLNPAMALFCRDVKRYIQSAPTSEDTNKPNADATETVYKATRVTGESCHFGSESAATTFAGKRGTVTAINIEPDSRSHLAIVKNNPPAKQHLADKITALVQQMQEVATEIDYYGGMAEWAQHGAELMNASFTAETWAEGIRAEAENEAPRAPDNYCYAATEEGPYQDSEGYVAGCLMEDRAEGETVTIWRGIKTPKRHSDFISFNADDIIERMNESAFEECGEVADDYILPLSPEQEFSLESHLNNAAAKWFNQHIPQPTFWIADKLEEMELTL